MSMRNGEFTGELLHKRRWVYSMYRPHDPVDVVFNDETLTRQEFKDESDINFLMKRYKTHGVMPTMRVGEPRYLDCTEVPDFQAAMQLVIDAEAAFMTLPAAVRKEFGNDHVAFVEYATDPENLDQMREWGLAPPEKAPDAPMRVEVVNAPANANDPAGSRASQDAPKAS